MPNSNFKSTVAKKKMIYLYFIYLEYATGICSKNNIWVSCGTEDPYSVFFKMAAKQENVRTGSTNDSTGDLTFSIFHYLYC